MADLYAQVGGRGRSVLMASGGGSPSFDSSEYRQNTYGAPDYYCDPTRSLASNGAGTSGDPWNLNQAMTNAVAGDVVGFLPGVGVDLPTTDTHNQCAFQPTNSGTSGNRIVFVTKFAAIALANVETNGNRTELRHDGTPAIANGPGDLGTPCPMYGVNNQDYVTFDGFYVDMAEAEPRADGGVIRAQDCVGIHFRNFVIKGTTTNMGTNPVIYRPQNAVDTILHNFRTYDFDNDGTGSDTPQNALFSDAYADQNFICEYFDISNTERGPYLKGTSPGPLFNYGTFRYGISRGQQDGIMFNDLDGTNVTELHHCLFYDCSQSGVFMIANTTNTRNFLMHHVTVARMTNSINLAGAMYWRTGCGSNVIVRDNLFDISSGSFGHMTDMGELTTMPATFDYHGHYKNGSAMSYTFNGVQYNSLAAWRTATSRSANDVELSTGPFVDRANANFRISDGHAAKTLSSTGGEIGCYEGSIVPGPYGSY